MLKVKFRILLEVTGDSLDNTPFGTAISKGYADGGTMNGDELASAVKKQLDLSKVIEPLQANANVETKNFDFDPNGQRLVAYQNLKVITYESKFWVDSISYEVVQIIDARKYLVVEPKTGEILTINLKETSKVYKVEI